MNFKRYVPFILIVAGILSLLFYKTAGYIMQSKELPKISVVLGDTIDSVEQHSTYPFKKKLVHYNSDEVGFVLTQTPMTLEYRDEQHGFNLPPTIFLNVDFDHSKATYIRMSPQLELLNLTDVTQLAKELIDKLNQTGWQEAKDPYFATPDKFAKIFANRQASGKSVVSIWTLNDKEMVLRIKRNLTKEDLLEVNPHDQTAEDQFLLDLEIYYKSF